MEYRLLGKTGLSVSALGLGCARLGTVTRAGGDRAALKLISAALYGGINFFDTADIYGQGRSEELLGRALEKCSERVIIATKAGYRPSAIGSIAGRGKPVLDNVFRFRTDPTNPGRRSRSSKLRQDFSAGGLTTRVEASLRRLRRESLDLFQLHGPPRAVIESGEVFEVLEKLKKEGKIKNYGVACLTVEDGQLCLRQAGVAAIQVPLSLLAPTAAESLLADAHSLGVGVVARQVFAGGLLISGYNSLTPDHVPPGMSLASFSGRLWKLEHSASEVRLPLAQLSLQIPLRTHGLTIALINTTRAEHLNEHIKHLTRPGLPRDEFSRFAWPALAATAV